jgi:hypothetical protein
VNAATMGTQRMRRNWQFVVRVTVEFRAHVDSGQCPVVPRAPLLVVQQCTGRCQSLS